MIEIKKVTTKRQRHQFVNFLFKLYKGNKYWAPPFRDNERNLMIDDKNPACEYCDTEWFLAYKDGKVVGRCGAIINHKANKIWNNNVVRITRFDYIDDKEVSKTLIDAVEKFGKENGMTEVQGPMGFTDIDEEGMLIDGFEELSTYITIYNYEYYVDHMEALGFKKDVDWVEYQIKMPEKPNPVIERIAGMVMKRGGYKLIEFTKMSQVKKYIPDFFNVWTDAYKDLYGTTPLTEEQKDQIVREYISFANPNFIKFIADKDDNIVAFGLCFPSYSKASQKANGNLLPFGIFHFLKALKKTDVLELFLIGVTPKLQGLGLNAILMDAVTKSALKHGIKYAESNPELEDNNKVRSQWKNFETRQHRKRRSYIKEIS